MATPLTIPPDWQHRITVDRYHQMSEVGVFDEDDRVELLEGYIVAMGPQTPPHVLVIQRLTPLLVRGLDPERWAVRIQAPLTLPPYGEPEPDVAVCLLADTLDPTRHPGNAALVIESAASSLRKDRLVKAAIYARAGITEYWIVNIEAGTVEVHQDPDEKQERYRTQFTATSNDTLRPVALDQLELSVAAFLPPS